MMMSCSRPQSRISTTCPGILFDWNKITFLRNVKSVLMYREITLKNNVIVLSVPFVHHTELQNFLIAPHKPACTFVNDLKHNSTLHTQTKFPDRVDYMHYTQTLDIYMPPIPEDTIICLTAYIHECCHFLFLVMDYFITYVYLFYHVYHHHICYYYFLSSLSSKDRKG